MSQIPVLKIKSSPETIRIVAKKHGDVSIQTINLRIIMANIWWAEVPELGTFFSVMELTIKKALKEVCDFEKLTLGYTYTANDKIEDASEIVVEITDVKIDDVDVEVAGRFIQLTGEDNRGFFKRLTSSRRRVEKKVVKEL